MSSLRLNSLFFRLLAASAIWTMLSLGVAGLFLSSNFRQNAEDGFRELLVAHTFNLMGALERDGRGAMSGTPNLGDPRFVEPLSGWYWTVARASDPTAPILASRSMSGDRLAIPPAAEVGFGNQFRRYYEINDFANQRIGVAEAQLFVDDSEELIQVMVSGNRESIETSIASFNRSLFGFFALFGFGAIVSTAVIVHFALAPLRKTRERLLEVREGGAERLEGTYPAEIEPLVDEVNALLAANTSVVERARVQVGNLAHALKTPLAVLRNETSGKSGNLKSVVVQQTETMQRQVDNYLNKARIAALRGTVSARCSVEPAADRIVRVISKLNPDLKVSFHNNAGPSAGFRGEVQDLEEILGNLIENAARFAAREVRLTVNAAGETLELLIDDDGPGLTEEQCKAVLKRGVRLDESTAGSGLGLSIVRDTIDEYEGAFDLVKSPLGGLRARVILPYVRLRRSGEVKI